MKKLNVKRLTLNRETLRQLSSTEVSQAGGAVVATQFNSCGGGYTCFCTRVRCTVGSNCCP